MKTLTLRPRPFLAATLSLALGLPLYALAKGDGPGFGHGRGRHGTPSLAHLLEKNAERLKLDTSTLARINDIESARKERAVEMHERAKLERTKLHEMLEADAPSEGAVMAQIDVLGDLRTDLQKERLSTMLQIRALLTPEQKAELAKLRAEHREKFKQHRQERRERRKSMQSGPEGAATPLAEPPSTIDGTWF